MADPRTALEPRFESALRAAFGDELAKSDPVLRRSDRADFQPVLLDFLRATTLYNSYRYLISAIVASREEAFIADLAALHVGERDRGKRAMLEEALALR